MTSGLLFSRLAWAIGLMLCASTPLSAQEFRIYTTVTDLTAPGKGKPPTSTSLTLFHAGKVYDYVEAWEETIIFEPSHNRFLVLSKRHQLATQITQDEIRRFLGLAHSHARDLITEWQRQGAERETAIAALEFQLVPEFEVEDDERARTLTLRSPHLRYEVAYAAAPSPDLAQAYLKSADWTAQLNSVLHPLALLPEPRLRVNDELRKRNLIPVEVDLHVIGERAVHLKARHEWTWKLKAPNDLKMIDVWESRLRQTDFRTIPFQEFQQQTLSAVTRKK